MMADDREILREVWDGRLPVVFTLSPDEVEVETPEHIYIMAPRQSYFPLVTEKVVKYLSQFVEKEKLGEMWIEYEGQPLRWHYPVGLLYDLYGKEANLPWNLTIHFQNFPEEELMFCPSKEAVEAHFMTMVKEADALKHRSHLINNMQKKDHKQMWNGLANDKYDQFWLVNKKLMENSGDETIKHIPFKIYQADGGVIQKLFRPVSEEGHEQTLQHLLEHCLPHTQGVAGQLRVVIQGIEPPLDTPLIWLTEYLSYPDNFLHICVTRNTPDTHTDTW